MGSKRNKKEKPYGPGDTIKITLNQYLGQEVFEWLNNQEVVATEILKILIEHIRNQKTVNQDKIDVISVKKEILLNDESSNVVDKNEDKKIEEIKEDIVINVPKKSRIKRMIHSSGTGLVEDKKVINPLLKNKKE